MKDVKELVHGACRGLALILTAQLVILEMRGDVSDPAVWGTYFLVGVFAIVGWD